MLVLFFVVSLFVCKHINKIVCIFKLVFMKTLDIIPHTLHNVKRNTANCFLQTLVNQGFCDCKKTIYNIGLFG